MFEIVESNQQLKEGIIKVVGVGGGGGNAVDHMIRSGVVGVEYINLNTDAQALARSVCDNKVQLGSSGLGAGAKPEVARQAAEESREHIAQALQGARLVFITAGMGGGTGTGAAAVVAKIAREMGILTVAVVTKPFEFEQRKRMSVAETGIAELEPEVDSMIVILNEKLLETNGDSEMLDAFHIVNNVLRNAVAGISEIIHRPGLINVDFEDVRTVMEQRGVAMMGTGEAHGVDRARRAADQALSSPLLEGVKLEGARGVLLCITAAKNLRLQEVKEVCNLIGASADEGAHVIYGAVFDEQMQDTIRVTVVATGLARHHKSRQMPHIVEKVFARTGTEDASGEPASYQPVDLSGVIRTNRNQAAAMAASGIDKYDIPSFLRNQAD